MYMYYSVLLRKFEIKLNLVGIQKNLSAAQNYNTHVKKRNTKKDIIFKKKSEKVIMLILS